MNGVRVAPGFHGVRVLRPLVDASCECATPVIGCVCVPTAAGVGMRAPRRRVRVQAGISAMSSV